MKFATADPRPVAFRSGSYMLAGSVHGAERAAAGVVIASGFLGLKEWVPARVAPVLVRAGYSCLAFDYRGTGASEGDRGRLIPEEEADDLRSACALLRSRVDRVAVLGWGFGAGVAIQAAAADPAIAAVVCVNGVFDVARAIGQEVAALCAFAAATARDGLIDWERVVWPFRSGVDAGLVDRDVATLGKAKTSFQRAVPLESAKAYYRFRADDVVGRIAPRPILFLHGSDNELYPVAEARAMLARAGEPKALAEVPGAGHLDLLDDAERNLAPAVRWLLERLPP